MTISDEESRDWTKAPVAWVGARWRWLVVAVLLLFALNNFVGAVVGIMGLIAVVNGVVGRALRARRVLQQIQQVVASPENQRSSDGH